MRLGVSSNFLSGTFSCLEILAALLLVRCLTIILECLHVKWIYNDRSQVKLSASCLDDFANFGLTSKKVRRTLLFISTSVVILFTIAGFAIIGERVENVKKVKVRNLVTRAATPINFTNHVSFETYRISGTAAVTGQYGGCQTTTPEELIVYQFSNTFEDLSNPVISPPTVGWNQTCITRQSGFAERTIVRRRRWSVPGGIEAVNCKWSADIAMPYLKLTRSSFKVAEECPFSIVEVWCLRSHDVFCAALFQVMGGFTTGTYIYGSGHSTLSRDLLKHPLGTVRLQSMVALMAVRISVSPEYLSMVSELGVETDVYVEKLAGEQNETRINLVLFACTLGPAVVIMVITAAVACFLWVKVMLLPGRRKYNRFNSGMDLLSFAAAVGKEDTEGMHICSDTVTVGISAKEPHVGPLKESDLHGTGHFHEDELVGRGQRNWLQ